MNELREIEVDEVSLVDRPATGRRFVLFKRAGLLRRVAREEEANICSNQAGPDTTAGEVTELRKRAEAAEATVARLQVEAAALEKRIEAIENVQPRRQSEETPRGGSNLWCGVL